MFFIERHYLKKHSKYLGLCICNSSLIKVADASFSENFYGLKRRRKPFIETDRAQAAVGGIPPQESLGTVEIWRSLLFLVCF